MKVRVFKHSELHDQKYRINPVFYFDGFDTMRKRKRFNVEITDDIN